MLLDIGDFEHQVILPTKRLDRRIKMCRGNMRLDLIEFCKAANHRFDQLLDVFVP